MTRFLCLRKSKALALAAALLGTLLTWTWLQFRGDLSHLRDRLHAPILPVFNLTFSEPPDVTNYHPGMLIDFWDTLSQTLVEAKPTSSLPTEPIEAPINNFASIRKPFNYRPDLLSIPQENVDELRAAHSRYVDQIPQLAPKIPFARGTKGIVTTASGKFMPILVVSIRMLRRTGSELPVHVFMESKDVYEQEICDSILPPLNARCLMLSDVLEAVPLKVEISHYQLKAFALLFSSFDEIVLLDSDNLAIEPPERLLNSEPFVSKGLVSWPDYWANTGSPKYYEISSQPAPSPSERAASESGQLLISKTKHAATLLLMIYYNYYGPSHYYKLLSQGAVGEGDKETYIAAATSLNASFYAVATNIETLGYFDEKQSFHGCGAIQFNPEDDFHHQQQQQQQDSNPNTNTSPPKRSFVHSQTHKMDASRVPATFHESINQRMWGPADAMKEKFGGRDIEKDLWAETLYTGCQLEHSFATWANKTNVCRNIRDVYHFLFN